MWLAIAIVTAVALGAWSTYDYELNCTKCKFHKHVVVERFLGIPFYRSTTEHGSGADYQRIFGQPCQHVFRRGGFGRSSRGLIGGAGGCGITAEGNFLRPRTETVEATFDLEHQIPNKELAVQTFQLIDRFLPPDARMEQREQFPNASLGNLFQLRMYLFRVQTSEQWRDVLECARENFSRQPQLPPDTALQPAR
jgi:hypothetical protein